jgi:hypothetical protein
MIAALFVETNGVYFGLPHVDPWDIKRDARKYAGPHPVVAHPPCGPWSKLAPINKARWGCEIGDDGGCFESALRNVTTFGGVLEHPAGSRAWSHFNLLVPNAFGWTKDPFNNGWVCEVSQCAYGHAAEKLTWLFANVSNPPLLNWTRPPPTATVSNLTNHGDSGLPRLIKKAAQRTPLAFRDLLISIAESVNQRAA